MESVLKNRVQQVVKVIRLGIGLWFLGSYITLLGQPSNFGWVAHAPLSHTNYGRGLDLTSAGQPRVWLELVAAWVILSAPTFKDRNEAEMGVTPNDGLSRLWYRPVSVLRKAAMHPRMITGIS